MISELTEITETTKAVPFRGWIFFDRDCSFCSDLARRFASVFAKRGFHFEPLQQPWVLERLGLTADEALEEMRVLTTDGDVFGGADAVVFLAQQVWWGSPFAALARFAFVHRLLDRSYRWVAAHRTCALKHGGTRFRASDFAANTPAPRVGRAEARLSERSWLALVLLPLFALAAKPFLPAWQFMWLMAFAIFFGCKWLTLGIAANRLGRLSPFWSAAYLFAWPGMDAVRFLSPTVAPRLAGSFVIKTVALAIARILIGTALLFFVARHASHPIVAGWIAMVGMILTLHFGLFALLSVAWRTFRFDAAPIMDAPLRSTSVAEFWGRRWNGAFNDLALGLVFRPMARRIGVAGATLSAFAVSGLIHELVISLPAGGGYGLPTGYFLLQGVAVLTQRQTATLRGDVSGWLFTMTVVEAPAFWLFHPLFVQRVIVPFMEAIGAL
jgi:predicted DCC family thiol-disulfide oxidoreductase YuxK